MKETAFKIAAASLEPGQAKGFEWRPAGGGRKRKGFLARLADGSFAAYENDCPHLGVPLDANSGLFFEEDARFLVCSVHGALFAPGTGECVAGPCRGESLAPLAVERRGEMIVVLERAAPQENAP